ncbi:YeeE/YedE family protein [Marmoricola endophyticus]|nr:YeeE/YedE family protein [Marmoricola endophyticus]
MIWTGLVAGALLGLVLQRSGMCFHSMFATAGRNETRLLRGWLVGVAIAGVLLSAVYLTPAGDALNSGLPFRPVGNVVGGLLIGVGMAVARSCASGLFYKLGTGMLGALVGIVGFVGGEYAATFTDLRGPTVLPGGDAGTISGSLGLPRLVVAVVIGAVLLVAAVLLGRRAEAAAPRSSYDGSQPDDRWSWRATGVAIGLAVPAAWLLARVGGSTYGPSTVGATASLAAGSPNWWLIAFLVGLVPGAFVAARRAGDLWVRGETPVRYVQLLVGGFLLGAGGWIAGGCNLGHGLSGVAQLNVASWVAVVSMFVGVVASRTLLDARNRR